MRKNPYVFTPGFSKDKTNNENVQSEGTQNMSNESKNNCEKGSVYSFGNNSEHHSYTEINQCSNPQKNYKRNKELTEKSYNSYTSKEIKNKYSPKKLLNKTNELIKEINNPSLKNYSRNNNKIITNNTMPSSNYIKNLPKASSSKKTQKDVINSYKDKKIHKKNEQATEEKKNTEKRIRKSPRAILNSVLANKNNPNKQEKKNYNSDSSVGTNAVKAINIHENIFNKNTSATKEESPKISNKDSKFNNDIHLNNLNNIHLEENGNIDNDNNIQMPKKNQSLEEMMKVMLVNVNNFTLLHSQYMKSQTDFNGKLGTYIKEQKDINKKLDEYISGQNDINKKLIKYLDANNEKNNKKYENNLDDVFD